MALLDNEKGVDVDDLEKRLWQAKSELKSTSESMDCLCKICGRLLIKIDTNERKISELEIKLQSLMNILNYVRNDRVLDGALKKFINETVGIVLSGNAYP